MFWHPTGHVILSAGKNGLVAVSSPVNGATIRVIRDHKGAPITTIQCVNEQVSALNHCFIISPLTCITVQTEREVRIVPGIWNRTTAYFTSLPTKG